MKKAINLHVNGEDFEVFIDPRETLLDVLRDTLGMTGTKEGCDGGDCGGCTVIVDGKPLLSCITLAVKMEGHEIVTIEGVADGSNLHPIQESFVHQGAIQCGFCSPGMIMSAKALLDYNNKPTREEIKKAIGGNLCRCTGYVKIIDAIEDASQKISVK